MRTLVSLVGVGLWTSVIFTSAVQADCSIPDLATAQTSDQLTLRFKRYANPDKPPVILMHGLGGNDRFFDIPHENFSIAKYLCNGGMDVWILNLRGAGTPGYKSDGPSRWTIDDYVTLDLPAGVNEVRKVTGKKPFLLTISLGGWVTNGYLQGVTQKDGQLTADPELAAKRNAELSGAILFAPALNLRWEITWKDYPRLLANGKALDRNSMWEANPWLEAFARSEETQAALLMNPQISSDLAAKVLWAPLGKLPFVGEPAWNLYDSFIHDIGTETLLFYVFLNPDNVNMEAIHVSLQDGLDTLSTQVLVQTARSARDGTPRSFSGSFDYLQRMNQIRLPLFFFGGGKDVLANHKMIFEDGYSRVGSSDKKFVNLPEYGHFDFFVGNEAEQEVYKPSLQWMLERAGNTASASSKN